METSARPPSAGSALPQREYSSCAFVLPQAGDHRELEHVVALGRAVGHRPRELGAPALLLLGVGHLQVALVRDRNAVHVLQRYRPALALVALELFLGLLPASHRRQL